ncbi:MAG: HDIG domain-containing protein, partial [Chloroflexi bacterium]|nr:HDIG domain-containing protein [Chloroflexota bacterium]
GVTLQVGDVAPADVLSPRPISYASQVLTEAARDAAESAVAPIFDPPDARIGRRQVERLRAALNYVDAVRADSYATAEQQSRDLTALADVSLPAEVIAHILAFSDGEWEAVKTEAVRVLDQIMRGPVREDRVADVRRQLPTLVTIELSERQSAVVVGLVSDFVVANSLFNQAATEAARGAAREAVAPVTQVFATGQTLVTRGQVISAADYEAMQQLGLIRPAERRSGLLSALLAVLAAGAILALFVLRFRPAQLQSLRRLILFCALFLLFLLSARLMVPGRTVMPYLFPSGALAIMLAVLFGPQFALLVAVILGALVGIIGGNSLELAVYASLGGILATLSLSRGERVTDFLRAGLLVALGNIVAVLLFRLPDGATDLLGLTTLLGAGLFNGLSVTFSLPLLFALGALHVADITTSLQLIELSRPDHPLLQFILRNAPGTYQHSLQVANLAEHAAEQIGASPILTRVGALYHDCGKALHPAYFVENQIDGGNVHDRLDPLTSVRFIIGHVTDGLQLARKYRLPGAIRDFIPEHHGTLRAMYQYSRAVELAGGDASKVDPADYSYPGPRPQSRETALLMLADACESTVRAVRPATPEEMDRLVRRVVEERVAQGQLNDTDLALRDLTAIRKAFLATLKGTFHARIMYPGNEETPASQVPRLPAAGEPALPPAP